MKADCIGHPSTIISLKVLKYGLKVEPPTNTLGHPFNSCIFDCSLGYIPSDTRHLAVATARRGVYHHPATPFPLVSEPIPLLLHVPKGTSTPAQSPLRKGAPRRPGPSTPGVLLLLPLPGVRLPVRAGAGPHAPQHVGLQLHGCAPPGRVPGNAGSPQRYCGQAPIHASGCRMFFFVGFKEKNVQSNLSKFLEMIACVSWHTV